jgi:CspA family cold shock protein
VICARNFTFSGPRRMMTWRGLANPRLAGCVTPRPLSFLFLYTLMLTGTVKFFDDTKGFGFIVADDTQEEIFVHQTGLIHEIQTGDRVQFDIKAGKKGPNAKDVTRLQ